MFKENSRNKREYIKPQSLDYKRVRFLYINPTLRRLRIFIFPYSIVVLRKIGERKMNHYITGNVIRLLRERKGYTQKELAEKLHVSDKTVSKWETGKGFPDISLIESLANALGVSIVELISGEYITNKNVSSKMTRTKFYVCPVCGNVIHSTGEGVYSCCGIVLPALVPEEVDEEHQISISQFEGETIVNLNHEMKKEHYISFIAYTTMDRTGMKKLYAEQDPEGSFLIRGHGQIYVYCNRHGLFQYKI